MNRFTVYVGISGVLQTPNRKPGAGAVYLQLQQLRYQGGPKDQRHHLGRLQEGTARGLFLCEEGDLLTLACSGVQY